MDEYVNRKKLEEAFNNADTDVCESDMDGHSDWGFGRENVRNVIRSVPAADVDRRLGWHELQVHARDRQPHRLLGRPRRHARLHPRHVPLVPPPPLDLGLRAAEGASPGTTSSQPCIRFTNC